MLGVATYDEDDPADDYLREYAEEIGVAETYAKTRVGVFLGEPRRDGQGPVLRRRRAGPHGLPALRALHGRLPARRQEHAGQELPVVRRARGRRRIMPERTVTDIQPLGQGGGYAVTSERSGAWVRKRAPDADGARRRRRRGRAGHEPAAGRVQAQRLAPEALDRLGELVRTNSEAILAVTLPEGAPD